MKYQGTWILLFLFISVFPLFSQQCSARDRTAMVAARSFSSAGPFALTIKREVEEVNLVLSVTDRRGHFVQGLTPSDLTILDDDKKQTTLTFFQSETNLPLHVALVLDVSASIAPMFKVEQTTIRDFLKQLPAVSPSPRNKIAPHKANKGVVQETELVMVGPMRRLPV